MTRALRRALCGRRGWIVVLGLALLARLVRYGVDFPIWGDEAFVGCSLLARDLAGLLEPLEFEMVVPLGWLLPTGWLAQRFDGATLALRLPALLAGCAALLLFARLARRQLPRATALLATAWLGGSYYLIRHGAEVKPYAFDLLAGTLLYGTALRALRREPGAWRAFTVVGVVAVWCSYPAIFVAAGAGGAAALAAAVGGRRRGQRAPLAPLGWPLREGAAALCAVAISFLAMYVAFGHAQQWSEERIADARHWDDHFLPIGEPWRWPWWLLRELTGNLLAYPNGGPNFGSSATFLLCVAGAIAWWRRGRRFELLVLLAPLAPMLLASALRKYPFGGSARIALHLAVPICLLAASGVAAIAAAIAKRRRAGVRTIVATATSSAIVLLLAFTAGSPVRDLLKPWKTEQDRRSREAFDWLGEQLADGDAIAVFGSYGEAAAPEVPDLRSWRGSSGRLRFHLLRLSRTHAVTVHFGGAAARDRPASRRLWTVVYRDNEAPFPEPLLTAWHATLGNPSAAAERTFDLGPASPDPITQAPRRESITITPR